MVWLLLTLQSIFFFHVNYIVLFSCKLQWRSVWIKRGKKLEAPTVCSGILSVRMTGWMVIGIGGKYADVVIGRYCRARSCFDSVWCWKLACSSMAFAWSRIGSESRGQGTWHRLTVPLPASNKYTPLKRPLICGHQSSTDISFRKKIFYWYLELRKGLWSVPVIKQSSSDLT